MFLIHLKSSSFMALAIAMGACSPQGSKSLRSESSEDSENIEVASGRAPEEIAGVNLNYDNARVQVLKSTTQNKSSYVFRAMVQVGDKLLVPPGKAPNLRLEWKVKKLASTNSDLSKVCRYDNDNLKVSCSQAISDGVLRLSASLSVSDGSRSRDMVAVGPEIDSLSLMNSVTPRRVALSGSGFGPSDKIVVGERDCTDKIFVSPSATSCGLLATESGQLVIRVLNLQGSEASAMLVLNSSGNNLWGDELVVSFVSQHLVSGDSIPGVGVLRHRPDGSWTTPEFPIDSGSPSLAVGQSSVVGPSPLGAGASVFTKLNDAPLESHQQSGQTFSMYKNIAADVFRSTGKIIFSSSPGSVPKLGALAYVAESDGYKVMFSESSDGETWFTPVVLSSSVGTTEVQMDKATIQLQYDLNGTPHVVLENRTKMGSGGPSEMENTYMYASGNGWNSLSADVLNTDDNQAGCLRDTGEREHQSPTLAIDRKGSFHIAFICNNSLIYVSNASRVIRKTNLLTGSNGDLLRFAQIQLNKEDRPTIMVLHGARINVLMQKPGGWIQNEIFPSTSPSTATLAYDGSGIPHVLWAGDPNVNDHFSIYHTHLTGPTFASPEVLHRLTAQVIVSPYHARVPSIK